MQVTRQELSPCEVELKIEVGADKVGKAIDEAYGEYARYTNVPGFRKGKAPRTILERYVSEDKIKELAAEKLMTPAYSQALEESGLEPWAQPEAEVVQIELDQPFIFKAVVPLPPKVELGDYVGIEVERLVAKVSDEDIDKEIEGLRERTGEIHEVQRPVQSGDLVVVELKEEDKDEEPERRLVEAGQNLPGFDEGLIGMSADEEKDIQVTYPEDVEQEELRGKTTTVHTKVIANRERILPEMTDEWVQSASEKFLGEKVETLDELKAKIREARENIANAEADRQVSSKLVSEIVERSNVCMPHVMVDHEVAHRLQEILHELEHRQMTLEAYLEQTGRGFEQVRSEVEDAAERDLKVSLVLSEIGERENIKVEESDVEEEITRMAEANGVPKESVRAYLDKTEGLHELENRILRRKILDFLMHASNIKKVGQ